MFAAALLRPDFNAHDVRGLAWTRRDAGQNRRLSALDVIDDVGCYSEAAPRDWFDEVAAKGIAAA